MAAISPFLLEKKLVKEDVNGREPIFDTEAAEKCHEVARSASVVIRVKLFERCRS
jgi:hypothetical protein